MRLVLGHPGGQPGGAFLKLPHCGVRLGEGLPCLRVRFSFGLQRSFGALQLRAQRGRLLPRGLQGGLALL